MKRILVFSWFYPPVNSSEGLVTFKLLNNSRYEYDVYTQKGETIFSYGENAALENGPNVSSVYAKSRTIEEWRDEAVAYFRDHKDEYDCIMTRSMPQESHEIGAAIKKEFPSVYWIASFGDPIKNNPYQHINYSLHSYHGMDNLINRNRGIRFRLSPLRIVKSAYWRLSHRFEVKFRRHLAKIEDDALRLCDCVIYNNGSQQKFMSTSKEILEKSVVLHHSYDETLYPEKKPKQDDIIRFLFVGHLDDIRTIRPLFEAVKELKSEDPGIVSKAQFDFYGDMSDGDLLYWVKNELGDVIKLHSHVPYLESLELMRNADWNIHVDGNIRLACDENVFFAAKVADYFGAGSKILAITMPSGSTHDRLKDAGELVLSYSAKELKQYLYAIIYKGFTVETDDAYIKENFSAKKVAEKFDNEVILPFAEKYENK
ncbi:MAG: glycosyltransferase family 1 protein [Clostridia bacterium]|nr:glycosyltransferase family 1 protein [Clostridia bacterium]